MPSVLRESTDTDAPPLTSEAGSLTNLLKAVLVDGYGTQAALGWSVLFEEDLTKELVIQSNSGTRFPVKISDNRSATNFQTALVTAYESMSTINVGYMPCPQSSAGEYRCICKSSSNSGSSPIPWKIIGDDKGFWILVRGFYPQYGAVDTAYGKFWIPHYIGDYNSIDIGNRFNFVTLLSNSNFQGYFRNGVYGEPFWLMRDPHTQESGSQITGTYSWHTGLNYLFGNNVNVYGISPVNGRYLYESSSIWQNNQPVGRLPGFYNMLWRSKIVNTSTSYFQMDAEELEDFFDVENEAKKIYVFPFRNVSNNAVSNGHYVHRGSILVGEGFRNAY
jgi:hypothetical protein